MDEYSKELCSTKHDDIKQDIKVINKRLDGHDEKFIEIDKKQNEYKDLNTQSHFELREAITEIKNCISILTQNQANKTEITKGRLALYGVIITAMLGLVSSLSVVVVTNLMNK